MRRVCFAPFGCYLFGIALSFMLTTAATAETVWSGFDFSFSKANNADYTLPENQDRITNKVWLTRDVTAGIFNYQVEAGYEFGAPHGTQWATALNNPGKTIAATNWSELAFTDWIGAYGGGGGMQLPARLLANNAVVRLVEEDIYLDLKFTGWTPSAGGGGFSYLRSESIVPEPSGAILAIAGLMSLRFFSRYSARRPRHANP